MRKIRWNSKARIDYFETIDYLLEYWSENEAQNFIDEVNYIEFLLRKGNVGFQKNKHSGGCQICISKTNDFILQDYR